ncbi:MAG: DUF2490 domain-containing protein [Gemmatimonadota bacterium]
MRIPILIAASLLLAAPCAGQTVSNAMVWGAAFGDHRFGSKSSLYWDYQPRRAEAGKTWQIQVGALGYTRDLSKQWRATAALGWSLANRYGPFAPRTKMFELRPWMQLTGTRPVGTWTWSDRSRAEFRVLRPVGEFAPDDADWAPTVVRLRRLDRFQHPIGASTAWYGAIAQEFLVNVHPERSRVAMLEQSRTQFLVGKHLTPRNRLEGGYGLQFWNRRGGNEANHTALLYFRTTVPFR